MRVRCILAIVLHAHHLLSPRMMGEVERDIFCDLAGLLGNATADVTSETGRQEILQQGLHNHSKEGSWSTFWNVAALAWAVGKRTRLIYPHHTVPINCNQRHVLNRVIHPPMENDQRILNVLWSWFSPPKSNDVQPNHFVPCLYCDIRLPRDTTDIIPISLTAMDSPICLSDTEDEL